MDKATYEKAEKLDREINHLEDNIRMLEKFNDKAEMPFRIDFHFDYHYPAVIQGPRNENEQEKIPFSKELMNFFEVMLENYRERLNRAKTELKAL